jgi:HlyD family secretion protein
MRDRSATQLQVQRTLRVHGAVGLSAVIALFGAVGVWAATTELSQAVIAQGEVVVEGNSRKIKHVGGGVVTKISIKEGSAVNEGDLLAQLDRDAALAELNVVRQKIADLEARKVRLKIEHKAFSAAYVGNAVESDERLSASPQERRLLHDRLKSWRGQDSLLAQQINQANAQISGLAPQQQAKARELALLQNELDSKRQLVNLGAMMLSQYNAIERALTRVQGEHAQLLAAGKLAEERIAELELQRTQSTNRLRQEVSTELSDVENQLSSLYEEEGVKADRLSNTTIRAPVSGTVHLLAVNTIGSVIALYETIMEIVPTGSDLLVDSRIALTDIDQVAVGQKARLRLSAYNRNTTPELFGKVRSISPTRETDALTGAVYFRATIELDDTEGSNDQLSKLPGMPVEVFILKDDRTVASYFMKPLSDHMNRVFREE